MLVSDVQATVMHEGVREVFVRARTWFEDMEFVCCKGGGS